MCFAFLLFHFFFFSLLSCLAAKHRKFEGMFSRRILNLAASFSRKVNVAQPQFTLPSTIITRNISIVRRPVVTFQPILSGSSSVAVSIMKRSMMTLSSSIVQKGAMSKSLVSVNRMSSTMKKRRMKMNKHKLKKRRKALRMNTKASREA